MKIRKSYQRVLSNLIFPPTTIARFGPARLVRLEWPSARRGRHELIGGTAEHQAAAREWCSLFAPEIVFATGEHRKASGANNTPSRIRPRTSDLRHQNSTFNLQPAT
ncbi:MAG: hypothetical protein WCS42_17375 [Verrucomicrobiota bacterium]